MHRKMPCSSWSEVIILLSQDILIWATSYIIVTAAQENLQVEAKESYYLL